jgi:hypothetical protein
MASSNGGVQRECEPTHFHAHLCTAHLHRCSPVFKFRFYLFVYLSASAIHLFVFTLFFFPSPSLLSALKEKKYVYRIIFVWLAVVPQFQNLNQLIDFNEIS